MGYSREGWYDALREEKEAKEATTEEMSVYYKAVYFGIIQGIISVVILYFIAEFTGAVDILNIWFLGLAYVVTDIVLNIIIPGRWR